MDIKIMVACHKLCDIPNDSVYFPVFVGSAGKEDIGFTRDDTGEQISAKNPLYCELTGLYWCWKNLDCNYLGLVHYRRFFCRKNSYVRSQQKTLDRILTGEVIEKLLQRYLVIVPKKRKYYHLETIYTHYAHTFDGRQLDLAREVIAEKTQEYLNAFDDFMKSDSGYMFNMFIMPKVLSDEYCEWLFDILESVEERYDVSRMTPFEKRYIGRISERLFNVWLLQQVKTGKILRGKIKEVPYMYLGKINWKKKVTGFLKAKLFHVKYKQSF